MTIQRRKAEGGGGFRVQGSGFKNVVPRPSPLVPISFCALLLAFLSASLAYADEPQSKAADNKPASAKPAEKSPKPAAKENKPADNKPASTKPVEEDTKPAAKDNKRVDRKEKPAAREKKPADTKPADKGTKPGASKLAEKKPTDGKPASTKPVEENARPAEKETEPVDMDLAIQGEFVGTVTLSRSRFQQIGLQIRATGGGTFEAAQYLGGLPRKRLGLHKDNRPAMLIGKRHDDFLVLSGGQWAVFVEPDHCLMVDRHGNRVGRLDRVHRQSPTLGANPPKSAVVLFDGTGTDQFTEARMTEDGLLMEGADVKPMFTDFNLHLEFMLPFMPDARGQARGNSGVYLQSRYEVQVLDSFAMEPPIDGCGALYKFRKPDVNMCFPPLVWQTYDIVFTAARWASDGSKLKGARITVWQNGVKIHNNIELPSKTGAGQLEEPILLPIRFQNHGNPVRFRNIWLIDRGAAAPARFPVGPGDGGGDKS